MTSPSTQLLEQLLTEDLSGVTFVRDYLQLEFNPPPRINVYSPCSVYSGDASATFGDEGFANLIIGFIGKNVASVDDSDETFIITFEDHSRIVIPFADGRFEGPEAFVFWGTRDSWGVWPG